MKSIWHILLLSTMLLTLSACGGWLSHETLPRQDTPRVTLRESHPIGQPTVTVTTTDLGWHITAQQSLARIEDQDTPVTVQVRRYVIVPYAPFRGLLECPFGALTMLATLGHYGHDRAYHGCLRLLMIEELQGSPALATDVVRTTRVTETQEPLQGAVIRIMNSEGNIGWTDILDNGGAAVIPYHIVSESPTDASRSAQLLHNNAAIWTGPLPSIPNTIVNTKPEAEWPNPLVIQIDSTDPDLQDMVIPELVRVGFCVVSDMPTTRVLQREARLIQIGRTEELPKTDQINWVPATVLARPVVVNTGGTTWIEMSWVDAKKGTILETLQLPTGAPYSSLRAHLLKRYLPKLKTPPAGCIPS